MTNSIPDSTNTQPDTLERYTIQIVKNGLRCVFEPEDVTTLVLDPQPHIETLHQWFSVVVDEQTGVWKHTKDFRTDAEALAAITAIAPLREWAVTR